MGARSLPKTLKRSDVQMSATTLGVLSRRVRALAKKLRLHTWDIRISQSYAEEGVTATMAHWPGQMRATLAVSADFFEQSEADQTQTLIHELVHCHLFNVSEHVEATAYAGMSAGTAAGAVAAINTEVDRATDALADVLAGLLAAAEMPARGSRGSKTSGTKPVRAPAKRRGSAVGTKPLRTVAAKKTR